MATDISINFDDLTPVEVVFPYNNEGTQVKMVLKEATAGAVANWRNFMFKHTKVGADGRPTGIGDGMADNSVVLLARCLFQRVEKGDKVTDVPVTEAFVKCMPNRLSAKLFETLTRISKLDEEATVEGLDEKILQLQQERERLVKGADSKNALTAPTTGTSA